MKIWNLVGPYLWSIFLLCQAFLFGYFMHKIIMHHRVMKLIDGWRNETGDDTEALHILFQINRTI